MKTIIKYGLCAVIALFVIALFLDENEPVKQEAQSEASSEKSQVEVKEDAKKVSSASWGDGTVRKISTDEYRRYVVDYTNSAATYNGDGPCVVDFYAVWCGPCKALSPRLESLAKEYKGKVQFYKVDVDDSGALAAAYGIRSIPTLFFFKDGKQKVYMGAPYNLEELVEDLAQ
ncbi:MAG: thioredoxin [Paludibacteraceae bacterium]|nr:thioredoxin [Paludibacteraceae bacterium]